MTAAVALLRTSLIMLIVCLFVTTGHTAQSFGLCCKETTSKQTQHSKVGSKEKPSGDSDHCQCLCHQTVAGLANQPVHIIGVHRVVEKFLRSGNQYPPESLPLGIDYPPQLS